MKNHNTRDPKRIKVVMSLLEEIWEKQPDTRFNQLISNLTWEYNSLNNRKYEYRVLRESYDRYIIEDIEIELYNVEDDDFIEFLKNKLN